MGRKIIEPGLPAACAMTKNHIIKSYNREGSDCMHFVLWSGGTDSTLLLYELLEAYGPEKVVAVSYIYPWLTSTKIENEKEHRRVIKEKIKLLLSLNQDIRHTEFNISREIISGEDIGFYPYGLPQAVQWLSSIGLYLPDNSYVYCGAIRNDDLTLFLESYHKMFDGMAATLARNITLREPYLYFEKYQVIDKIFQYRLYDETWTCEMPKGLNKPCWKCQPCITHYNALLMLIKYGSSELIKMKAKEEFERIIDLENNEDQQYNEEMIVDN